MIEFQEIIENNFAIIKISGNMVDQQSVLLTEKVKKLATNGIIHIILDLSDVKLMNSSYGLGVLLACWGSLNRYGGRLLIANPSEKASHLFEITQLNQVIEIFNKVEEAKQTL